LFKKHLWSQSSKSKPAKLYFFKLRKKKVLSKKYEIKGENNEKGV